MDIFTEADARRARAFLRGEFELRHRLATALRAVADDIEAHRLRGGMAKIVLALQLLTGALAEGRADPEATLHD